MLLLLLCCFAFASAAVIPELTGHALVNQINTQQNLWKASLSPLSDGQKSARAMRMEYARHKSHTASDPSLSASGLPAAFDARTQWPHCPSIGDIKEQGDCGNCWALAATSVMTDRICIHSDGKKQVNISAVDVTTCCTGECGQGCQGGEHIMAWDYYVKTGIVSGGAYHSESGCKPYLWAPCKEWAARTNATECHYPYMTAPACESKCRDGYAVQYEQDRHFGHSYSQLANNPLDIMHEVMTNGPVQTTFTIYDDMHHYTGGIYVHVGGKLHGAHSVKIIGWGSENGTPYWLVANSFGRSWGEDGFFRIIRGLDEIGIEDQVTAGLPL